MALVLIAPAADYQLLTPEELRVAVGLQPDDTSQDAVLTALGLEAAEWVATLCGVPTADGYLLEPPVDTVPTFRAETVAETRMLTTWPRTIALARRFVSSVSATLNGADVLAADYRINSQAGTLERVVGGMFPCSWGCGTLVITYTAGFVDVPPALKGVASDYLAHLYTRGERDVTVRSETVNDIESVTYRPGDEIATSIADTARQRLSRYMTGTHG